MMIKLCIKKNKIQTHKIIGYHLFKIIDSNKICNFFSKINKAFNLIKIMNIPQKAINNTYLN